MALNSQDTNVSTLVINKCTKDQYDSMESHSESELYVVPEDIDAVPTLGSFSPVSSSGVKSELDTKVSKSGDTITGKLTLQNAFNPMLTGSGTAATDKGEGVANRYVPAKWTFNTGRNAVDGDIYTIKIPVAGHSYGIYMSVNNGTNYYPVNITISSRLGTQYPVNVSIMVMFDSTGLCNDMFPLNGGDARGTVSGGVFRVINYYDSNTDIRPSAYCETAAGTAAKTASCTNYALLNKSFLHVVMRYSNTSASALTLNVNSRGAKAIYINGNASSSSNYTLPAGSYIVYYQDSKYYFYTNGYFPAIGGVTSKNKYISSYTASTFVNGLTNACFQATGTTYDSWICGPTKNGNICISTHPEASDILYIGYGEKNRTTNTFAHQMCWTGSTGYLTLDNVPVCTRDSNGNLSNGDVMIWNATSKKLVGMPIQAIATADSTHQGIAESSDVVNYINNLQSQITILKQENKILKSFHSAQITDVATFRSLVVLNTATSIVFDFKNNQSTTGYTLAGYIDANNEIEVWNNSTDYLVLSNKFISAPEDCTDMFNYCPSLTSLDFSNFDTTNVTNMGGMFYYCTSLTSLDLSNFDTTNVTNMSGFMGEGMFGYCSSLTSLDLPNFDTTNVTNMGGMFYYCTSLTSLDLSNFDTTNVTNMYNMFYDCSSLTSLDLSNFDTTNVTSMNQMFRDCSSLTSLDLSNFDTTNVTEMSSMFQDCSSLTSLDLSNFDTTNVKYMSSMFQDCSSLTSLDLSNFDTTNVKYMSVMFQDCSSLTTIIANDWSASVSSTNMFKGCTSLVGGNGTTYNSSHTDAAYAHIDVAGNPGYFTAPQS